MEKFIFKGTDIYPDITLDTEKPFFRISGKSVPADGKAFFEPVLQWVEAYIKNPLPETHFIFNLEYFNISTSKMLLFILYKLNELKNAGFSVRVSWQYNDEEDEMFEVGEDYAFMVDIPFEFIQNSKKEPSLSASAC